MIRCSNDDERVRVAGELERERVGAALDRARELPCDDAERPRDDAAGEREGRQPGRSSPRAAPPAARPPASPPGATSASRPAAAARRGSARAQLVRDHRARLGRREARQQRVVEDHAPARAEAAHVRVGGVGAPARIDREHLAYADARPIREGEDLAAQLTFGQRREVIEHRLEQERARGV